DHLLQVEGQVRRYGGVRRQAAAGAGGREPAAQEAPGRTDAGQRSVEGSRRKKLLTPRTRHATVRHVVERHGLSQRRATRLLDVDRSAVRYRRKRKDDDADRKLLRALAAERRRCGYRRQAAAERLHGKLQWQAARRMPQRTGVLIAG